MGFGSLGARLLGIGKKIAQPFAAGGGDDGADEMELGGDDGPNFGQRFGKNLVSGLPGLMDQQQPSMDPNYQDQNYAMHEQRRARLSRLGM